MKVIKRLKENIFLIVVVLAYAVMLIFRPELSVQGVRNSGYYIKEMIMILPVVFILTALLDTWIPKEVILKYLGGGSKWKGAVLSFLFGSISAGPIYAAFPFCTMLRKKGASIQNIVIILSSWAVLKIPMLLNEAKFLGPKFMALRWILTVISIIVFSWIMSKVVKEKDMPEAETPITKGVCVNRDACMGCRACVRNYPELFAMDGKKATVKEHQNVDTEKLKQTVDGCPVKAISFNENDDVK